MEGMGLMENQYGGVWDGRATEGRLLPVYRKNAVIEVDPFYTLASRIVATILAAQKEGRKLDNIDLRYGPQGEVHVKVEFLP